MNKEDNFALVPRPPGALEKAEPGVRRILSGMVADTLALALATKPPVTKSVFTVLLGFGTQSGESFEKGIRGTAGQQFKVRFVPFKTEAELLRLAQEQTFDLIIAFLDNIRWENRTGNLSENNERIFKAIKLLLSLERQWGKRILTASGSLRTDLAEIGKSGDTSELWPNPFSTMLFWHTLQNCLGIPGVSFEQPSEIALLPRRTRRPRIVMLDDEPMVLDVLKALIQRCYEDATLLTFTDPEEAWRELLREDPDLFTTDWYHSKLQGEELLHLLAERKVAYPIFLISGSARAQDVMLCAGPDLNVTVLRKPFTPSILTNELVKHLGSANNPEGQKAVFENHNP